MSVERGSDSDVLSDTDDGHDTSSEAAGIVRGISRSLRSASRSIAKLPSVGSIPRRAVMKRRVPVKRVASVSDRVSTGIDLLSSAVESGEDHTARQKFRIRASRFLSSVVKNTILGAAVFETYDYVVSYLAPPRSGTESETFETDEYARASLGAHFEAGACAGSVHGIASTVWDSVGQPNVIKTLPAMIIHHSIAHSVLFGSYETIKRLGPWIDDSREDEIPYFASVTVSGGLAGQIQFIVSHYTEQWLGLAEGQVTPRPFSRNMIRFVASPPTLRPFLLAFPPSSISFLAFEYGKSFMNSDAL